MFALAYFRMPSMILIGNQASIVARFSLVKSYERLPRLIPSLFHKQVLHPHESHICNRLIQELHSFCHHFLMLSHFLLHVLMLSTQEWHI